MEEIIPPHKKKSSSIVEWPTRGVTAGGPALLRTEGHIKGDQRGRTKLCSSRRPVAGAETDHFPSEFFDSDRTTPSPTDLLYATLSESDLRPPVEKAQLM
ncbi:unnamed protein product [Lota lota]